MRFILLLFFLAAIWLPGSLYSQNLIWDTTFTNNEIGERINDISITSNGDVLCVGRSSPNSSGEPSMLKFDSLGNFKWFKRKQYDSFQGGNFNFIHDVPREIDVYYVGGSSFELGVGNNDFIAKIDTSGDTMWCKFYTYPTFYGTTLNAIVLRDKSIVSAGVIQTATNFDLITRRVDSMGNTMWERIYNKNGREEFFDIVEMLDGSIILTGANNERIHLLQINFNGQKIKDTTLLNSGINEVTHMASRLTPGNNILVSCDSFESGWFQGSVLELSENLEVISQSNPFQGIIDNIYVSSDSTYLIENSFNQDSTLFSNYDLQHSIKQEYLFPVDNSIRDIRSFDFSSPNSLVFCGAKTFASNDRYWISKLNNIKEEWVPDHCAYQPPRAGFDYEYTYPVLTLRDTSSGGLKYLDTVYTWQWNTSVGTNGTDDSLVVFFDTAFTKTIDIELIIGNWYGCTDTVNQTLVLGETGLEVYKELEVKVFPNPVKDILNVHIEDVRNGYTFSLYDLQGRLQFNKRIGSGKSTISMSELPQGLYIYRIADGISLKRGKVVKN